MPLVNLNTDGQSKPSTPLSTYQNQEGGDQSTNKIQPFPGYRDADVVDMEENDSWSEHTYDSDEERHKRNLFFSFLLLILCCALIVAAIIILFMVSTQNMKATVI